MLVIFALVPGSAMDSDGSRMEYRLCSLVSHLITPCLNFPIYKMGVVESAQWGSGYVCTFHFGGPGFTCSDPRCRPTHCSLSHAVAASHIEELE